MLNCTFLEELEPLTHASRVRKLVELGAREAQGDTAATALIDALFAGENAYERRLALFSVCGSRKGDRLVAAFADRSRSVRNMACKLLPKFGSDAEVEATLRSTGNRVLVRRACVQLGRAKRQAPLDAFFTEQLEGGPANGGAPELVDLFGYGSTEFVVRVLPRFEAGASEVGWDRLITRHAPVAAQYFLRVLRAAPALDMRLRHRMQNHLAALAEHAPDDALTILARLFELGEPASHFAHSLPPLVRHRPAATFDLLKARTENRPPDAVPHARVGGPPDAVPHARVGGPPDAVPPGAFGSVRFDKVVHTLGAARLDYLVRYAWSTLGDGKAGVRWFLRLNAQDRAAVHTAFVEGGRGGFGAFLFRTIPCATEAERTRRDAAFEAWARATENEKGVIGVAALAILPRELREREALRHLSACPALTSRPKERLHYASLLSFKDALVWLEPLLKHPEGDERAHGQRTLLGTLAFDFHESSMGLALESIRQRKFEQDPVRQAMLESLATLPKRRFGTQHLEALGVIFQDALDASDFSSATGAALERLVVRLFPLDGAWAAKWLAHLMKVRGSVSTWGLGETLLPKEAVQLAPALRTLAESWATKERAHAVIALAHSLGQRLPWVTPLLDALERLVRELPFVHVARAALSLLRAHDRPRFGRVVTELLESDGTYMLLPDVARYVSCHRQDLLPRFLSGTKMKGRFATGQTNWVLDFPYGTLRWTAKQQNLYAAQLARLMSDPDRDVPTLRFAITRLTRLPFADAAAALPFAADPRPPLREMAVRALPWLDAGQGVPVLIEALGDARARWAIYALRKAFSEMGQAEVLTALRAVPTTKVTVAKEVVRLLGDMGGAAAYEELLALDTKVTHRDVRIALLRALWNHLDEERTWAVFDRSAKDPDWILASKLAELPLDRLSDEAEARVAPMFAHLLGRPEPEARLSLLARAAYLPLRDGTRVFFHRLLAHLSTASREEATSALGAVLTRVKSEEVLAVSDAVRALQADREKMAAFVPTVADMIGPYAPPNVRAVATQVLEGLRADEGLVTHYIALGSRLWDADNLSKALDDLVARDLLHYDAMQAAMAAVGACSAQAKLEASLQQHRDPRVRRLGLAALVSLNFDAESGASPKEGWTAARRARLDVYRKDPSMAVTGPAALIFPPETVVGA